MPREAVQHRGRSLAHTAEEEEEEEEMCRTETGGGRGEKPTTSMRTTHEE